MGLNSQNLSSEPGLKDYITNYTKHWKWFVLSVLVAMAIAYAQFVLCNNIGSENTGGNESCNLKFKTLSHPDLHFVFPNVTTEDIKSKPKSSDFISDWREFVLKNPYGNLFDWYKLLGVDNKQGQIGVDEAHEIVKSLSLKYCLKPACAFVSPCTRNNFFNLV